MYVCIPLPARWIMVGSVSFGVWGLQELEKTASRKLGINAKEAMKISERLYTQGFISYPRTETNIFPKELDLESIITELTRSPDWGG